MRLYPIYIMVKYLFFSNLCILILCCFFNLNVADIIWAGPVTFDVIFKILGLPAMEFHCYAIKPRSVRTEQGF